MKEIEEKTDKLQKMVAPSNFLRPVEKRFMKTRSEVFSLRKILNLNYADIWNGIERHLNSKFKIDLQQELEKVKESYKTILLQSVQRTWRHKIYPEKC